MQTNLQPELWMYNRMVTSRRFEEAIRAAYLEGKQPVFNMGKGPVPGEMHLSNGQEPCAVGICAHLKPDDFLTATHRSHHFAIAKGVELNAMAAEIFGKKTGLSGGRGGHMHLFSPEVNFGCSGIIAEGMGPAAGAALAFKMRGERRVAVAEIGEGAANQGAFHEVLNLAALWDLPFICIVSDNAYGVSVAKSAATAIERNADRAVAYGIPGIYVEGNDPYKVYEVAGEAVERARSGKGPTLIEVETWRLEGHFMGDPEGYRPEGEKEALFARDPLPLMRERLIADGVADEVSLDEIEAKALSEVETAIAYARESDDPPTDFAMTTIFAPREVRS